LSVLQELLAGWLSALVTLLPVGYAFGAGMIAAVNPCGFAMLPAYLSLYLGAREEDFAKRTPLAKMLRALLVGGVVSTGFVLLFGVVGLVISAGGNALLGAMPTLAILIGGALILIGLALLAGHSVYIGVFERFAGRIAGDPGTVSVRGFFLFGLAYGAASLSCTMPVFLAVVGSGISVGGFLAGAGQFLGYGLGMASVFLALTLALAFFKQGLVVRIKNAVPYVQLASAVLLMLAGAYMIFYWLSSPTQGVPFG
jgi:cytochrome c-type biogenesis protein